MRPCVGFVLVLVSACAVGEVGAPPPRADISRLLYLNPCASGCPLEPGADNALTRHSSIVTAPTVLAPFSWGDTAWRQLVACVQHDYAPFDLYVTDEDPGDMPHFELVIGGAPQDLGFAASAAGVAPAQCPGSLEDNDVAFVFAAHDNDVDDLCWTAAQESAHMFGLDHEFDPADPMAWIGPVAKTGFQDHESPCGEYQARWCRCDRGATQNSYAMLLDTLGPAVVLY